MRTTRFNHKPGFTIMEVLITMGIFAIGFVAVAAIFPTAVMLQKKTIDDLLVQQAAQNAKATIQVKRFSLTGLGIPNPASPPAWALEWMDQTNLRGVDGYVHTALTTPPLKDKFVLSDRSYPTTILDPEDRRYFWVPLIFYPEPDTVVDVDKVRVYLLILQREPGALYREYPSTNLAPLPPNPGIDGADWDANGNQVSGDKVPKIISVSGSSLVGVDSSEDSFTFPGTFTNAHPDVHANGKYLINAGDQILDGYGRIYTVVKAELRRVKVAGKILPNPYTGQYPDKIMFAIPDSRGRVNPLRQIIILSGVVTP